MLVVHMRRHTGEKPHKCTVSIFNVSFITRQISSLFLFSFVCSPNNCQVIGNIHFLLCLSSTLKMYLLKFLSKYSHALPEQRMKVPHCMLISVFCNPFHSSTQTEKGGANTEPISLYLRHMCLQKKHAAAVPSLSSHRLGQEGIQALLLNCIRINETRNLALQPARAV